VIKDPLVANWLVTDCTCINKIVCYIQGQQREANQMYVSQNKYYKPMCKTDMFNIRHKDKTKGN